MACEDNLQNINDQLLKVLESPLEVRGDAGLVKNHSLSEIIAAHNHVAGVCGGGGPNRGLRFNSLIPGGTVYGSVRGCISRR